MLVSRLRSGALDGALLALEAELGEVEQRGGGRRPFLLAAPRGHPLAAGPGPARVPDLRGADVLLLDEGHCLRAQALEVCSRGRAREREFRATSLPTLVQMVASGAGVTLLPLLSVPTEAAPRRAGAARVRRPGPAPDPGAGVAAGGAGRARRCGGWRRRCARPTASRPRSAAGHRESR